MINIWNRLKHKPKVITKSKRLAFYQFALDVYKDKVIFDGNTEYLSRRGFCYIFIKHFKYNPNNIEDLLPELRKYKPTMFYDCVNQATKDNSQFWFPTTNSNPNIEQVRIKILTEIITNFK